MKRQTLFLASVLILSTVLFSCMEKQNVLAEKEKQDGWKLLFDGQSLNGWKNYNAPGITGWKVEDNCLASAGTGGDSTGYIISGEKYDNFELAFDWKIAAQGNSGVIYHVTENKKYLTPYLTGPEYQLLDDVNFPQKVEPWQLTGADYAMHTADTTAKKLNPAGQWNTSKIVFDNGHVEHWLNGKKIVEFEAWTPEWFKLKNSGKWTSAPEYGLSETGYISLQDHGSKSWFRNVKIKVLPKKAKPAVALFNGVDLTNWIAYGTEKWYAQDSLLICESGPDKQYGYLGTQQYYKDFDLTADFKQVSNGNSGIFFRSTVDGTTVSGWQVEVAPKGNDSGGIYESYGRGWLHQIPDEMENILKPGDWNTMRIKVVGSEVTTWLNGQEMTHLTDSLIGSANGRIALQIHEGGGIKVQWKNLVIQPL
jgi:hypothetical protein